jgi:transposase
MAYAERVQTATKVYLMLGGYLLTLTGSCPPNRLIFRRGSERLQIAELSDAAPNTVTATIRTYREKGLQGVQDRTFHCPPSQLDPYRSQLVAHFSVHPPRTLKEAAAEIERLTGLAFSLAHVRNVLLSLGLSRKKQEAFLASWTMPSAKSKKSLFTIS